MIEIQRNFFKCLLFQTCLNDVYQWQQEHLKKPAYVLHDGPPYANGMNTICGLI